MASDKQNANAAFFLPSSALPSLSKWKQSLIFRGSAQSQEIPWPKQPGTLAMNPPWPKQPQTNTAEQRLDGCCFQHALQSFVSASRPLWPPSIGLDSQRTLLSDKLCILFPKDRLAHLAMTPKKVDLGFKGNMTCLSTLNPTSSTCGLLPPCPKKAETAYWTIWIIFKESRSSFSLRVADA